MTEATTIIHLRFNNDGSVAEIGERPAGVKPQAWFKFLSNNTQDAYQALSGGRGMFRLPKTQVETLKTACGTELTS